MSNSFGLGAQNATLLLGPLRNRWCGPGLSGQRVRACIGRASHSKNTYKQLAAIRRLRHSCHSSAPAGSARGREFLPFQCTNPLDGD